MAEVGPDSAYFETVTSLFYLIFAFSDGGDATTDRLQTKQSRNRVSVIRS